VVAWGDVFALRTSRIVSQIDRGHHHEEAFAPAGDLVARSLSGGTIELNATDGALVGKLVSPDGVVVDRLKFSPRGDLLCGRGGPGAGTFVWAIGKAEPI